MSEVRQGQQKNSRKKILLADDDRDDSEMFCEAVSEVDPTVICFVATHGKEVLKKLDDGTFDIPDVIFLDLNMPQMNGWDCLKALKTHRTYQKIPVIIYSTSSAERDIQKARELGATYFLTKPDNYKELGHFIAILVRNIDGDLPDVLRRR